MHNNLTPAMKQYYDIKKAHQNAILFFRMGDFYETFGEDAKIASRELDIVLTSRPLGGKGEKIPLAGVPFHAVESYLGKLVKKGYKVAICEQMEDPKFVKGIVKRAVVRVVTPGTVLESTILDDRTNNYIAAVCRRQDSYGLAFADISTGDMQCTATETENGLLTELARFKPSELILEPCLLANAALKKKIEQVCEHCTFTAGDEKSFDLDNSREFLKNHFKVSSLSGFGCENLPSVVSSAGAVLNYLMETQKQANALPDTMRTYSVSEHMVLDPVTIRNLELVKNVRDGSSNATLLSVLDKTVCCMGARMLRRWILRPLIDAECINKRLDAVTIAVKEEMARTEIRKTISRVGDVERLITRINYGIAHGRDMISLRESLSTIPGIKEILNSIIKNSGDKSGWFIDIQARLDDLTDVVRHISEAIVDEPPISIREGNIIKDGYNAELDALRDAVKNGRRWIAECEAKERKRTGIKSLKIGYNGVFGYYIEVSKPNLPNVPTDYIRKQTIATGERYVTPELKEKEELILTAGEKSAALEYELFEHIRRRISAEHRRILTTATALAELDVIFSLAEVSVAYDYVRPEITQTDEIVIRDGRHPVVERFVNTGFVPNDTVMDCDENQILILTGPNMAGKSTYLRQIALIVLMAQIGSHVPAKYASIGIVERVFTRVGAYDDLTSGQSTFMVEMTELANILNNATENSLILLDEIGRGTSTFDGLSIACAVVEFLHSHCRHSPKTVFATHYHQLTQMSGRLKGLKNFHIAIKEENGEIVFLRKIVPGATDKSYGIHVARLAGVPKKIIERANSILEHLEKGELSVENDGESARSGRKPAKYAQVVLFQHDPCQKETSDDHPVISELRALDTSNMTPLQALTKLHELKEKAVKDK